MKRGLVLAMSVVGIAWVVRRFRAAARVEEELRVPVRSFDPNDPSDLNEAIRTYLASSRANRGVRPLQEIAKHAENAAHALAVRLDDDVCEAIGNHVSYSYR